MDTLLLILFVGGALIYLGMMGYNALTNKKGNCSGGCCSIGKAKGDGKNNVF